MGRDAPCNRATQLAGSDRWRALRYVKEIEARPAGTPAATRRQGTACTLAQAALPTYARAPGAERVAVSATGF